MWADRILNSAIAVQVIDSGQATTADLQRISRAWMDWAGSDDGWLTILHGEVTCRVK